MINPLFLIDGYKLDHRRQYPRGTTRVYSNWTPRSSRVQGQNGVVFFGLQYFIQRYLEEMMSEDFFSRPLGEVVDEYRSFVDRYLGEGHGIDMKHVEDLHGLGYIPLEFRALREGTICPLRVPALTVENTHDDFFWLVNYIETLMSNILWMPCTSATTAYRLRKMLNGFADRTGGPREAVQWQGHDFSMRGLAGAEACMLSGAGHLLSFTGTDTIPAIHFVDRYYGHADNGLIGASVAATEHSVMSCGGDADEMETFSRLLSLYPNGIVSIVSDTWDLWHVLTTILPSLKEKIMGRNGGKLVIRPDSGDPVKIVCGNPDAAREEERKGVIQLLWDTFGGTTNGAGYKELDPHVGCIYGDAITPERAEAICRGLMANGFASTNMVFGVGSYCVAPETLILCADLVWRPAGDLDEGQEIISFDENPSFGEGRRAARRYLLGTIEENRPATKSCCRLNTDIGQPVIASDDHPWLVWTDNRKPSEVFIGDDRPEGTPPIRKIPRTAGLVWRHTSELSAGDKIAYFTDPWSTEDTRDAGWLAGIFDGEGSLSTQGTGRRFTAWKANVSQNEGPVLERIKAELRHRRFDFYENPRKCTQLILSGGWRELLRFLGTIRPERLIQRVPQILADGVALSQGRTFVLATVTSVESVGDHDVASIRTSTGTFITGGYLTHNTYQYVTRDTYGFAMKATWAQVNGKGRDLFKKPATDDGVKHSAKGRLAVVEDEANGGLVAIESPSTMDLIRNVLEPVWRNGKFSRLQGFSGVRGTLWPQ